MLDKPLVVVRFADAGDRQQVNDFRAEQYANVPQFRMNDQSALRRQSGRILLAISGGTIISTMQMELVRNAEDMRLIDPDVGQTSFSVYPTMLLSRAGTARAFRTSGLNSLLRLLCLHWAQDAVEVQSLCGVVYEGSPRVNLLRDMGYAFERVAKPDEGYATALTTEYAVWLARGQFDSAARYLAGELEGLLGTYRLNSRLAG